MKIETRGSSSLAPPGCLGPLFCLSPTLFVVAETTSLANKACAVLMPHPWRVSPPLISHDPHTACPDTYGVLHVRSQRNLESCCSGHIRIYALAVTPHASLAPGSCTPSLARCRNDLLDQMPQPRALSPFDSHRCYLGDTNLYSNKGVDTVLSAPAVEILKSYGLEFITL
ncbi:hypothetical protein VNO77_34525 [Canavalia gladiata]|uniref:Uncharacterized protein n=1 Tax=Canavalia gladiata TaxID=3824 RepID=A0AAN9KGQ0_CANGL